MNDSDGLEIHTKNFNQFDRELYVKDNFKDQMIWEYLNRSTDKRKNELSDQKNLASTSNQLSGQKL